MTTDPTKWAIDRSTDSPILTYEQCSVIQDEQAEYVLDLIRRDAHPHEPSSASMGVVVMALDDWPNAGSYEANEARVYPTLLGKYAALRYGSTWALYRDDRLLNSHNSFEDAKAAAQADFEQRVRSCLSAAPSPSPAPGVVEAKKLLRDMAAMRFGCSGMTLIQVNDWFNEQAIAALASLSQPAKGEREGGGQALVDADQNVASNEAAATPANPAQGISEIMPLVEAYVSATVRCHNADRKTYEIADASRKRAKDALTAALEQGKLFSSRPPFQSEQDR